MSEPDRVSKIVIRLAHHGLGNASEIDIPKVQQELSPVLVPGEVIGQGFKLFRDMLIFTNQRQRR